MPIFWSFSGLCNRVRFFANTHIPGTQLLSSICWLTIRVVFFPHETTFNICFLTCYLSSNRHLSSRAPSIVATTFLYRYLLHCLQKKSDLNRAWRQATRMILLINLQRCTRSWRGKAWCWLKTVITYKTDIVLLPSCRVRAHGEASKASSSRSPDQKGTR